MVMLLTLTGCGSTHQALGPPSGLPDASPNERSAIQIPAGRIDDAVAKVDGLVGELMQNTGIPGMAVAIVHGGKTLYAKGFGVRDVGKGGGPDNKVDADTVFQLASVSKSVGATVVAHAVTDNVVTWDTPVVSKLPWFALRDPYVTGQVTIADLYSHRSGLPDHAGDLLEDLGYDRRQVLQRLKYLPLAPFRISYAYTNFGVTAAAEAVAAAAGQSWEDLSDEVLYRPLGMGSTSSRFTDFLARPNHAVNHVKVADRWEARYQRDPDAQSPAGGVSSSLNDMTHWLAMVLADGVYNGRRITSPEALLPVYTPQVISRHPVSPRARASFYGYGFNVGVTSSGRTEYSHSGAFGLGAAANFVVLPSEDLAIIADQRRAHRRAGDADRRIHGLGAVRPGTRGLGGPVQEGICPAERARGLAGRQAIPGQPSAEQTAERLRRRVRQRLLGARHRDLPRRPTAPVAGAEEPDVRFDALGRRHFHVHVVDRKRIARIDFQGHLRRRHVKPGILRRRQAGNVYPMTRSASATAGLTDAEVAQRVAEGKSNDIPERVTRTVGQIVRANVFTRINAILGVLLLIVLATGSLINGMFGLLIIANSVIGMVQEIRAKQTLDKLAIIGQAKPLVRRQSGTRTRSTNEVVLDDIIELGPGDQVVVDGEVVEEENLEIDESLLTGEADPIAKDAGDTVMSGSFVVSGAGAYRATKVGSEAYAAKLAAEASKFTLVKSELRNGINRILQFITYLLVPAGLLTIYTQLFTTHVGWRESVLRMVGALVPMVPEGLVLMTSIAFAVGVVRLGQRQCLVQELPAIEGLARVDVVCADKTGTLTESGMRVCEVEELDGAGRQESVADVLAALAAADARPNASMQAIAEAFHSPPGWVVAANAPFKSATKWSGVSFRDHGNWVIGAPDVLLDPASVAARQAERIGAQGLRVLLLAAGSVAVDHAQAPGQVTPVALVVLEQKVRPDARETLDYFAVQNVSVKVISGDNAVSVGAVADRLGLHGEAMDARALPTGREELADTLDSYTSFGRVRPDQKRAIVHALQSHGHTVAMTGDGVNDVLALKDADIGVAMGSGSPASRAVAQIVLLNNRFATLPHVVGEGRRVIGNIERVANLFLTKTVYSVLLALLVGIECLIAIPLRRDPLLFPFQPIHVTIAAWFTIGIPAFILSLAPNNERAYPGFVRRVMTSAVPFGLVIGVATFVTYLAAYQGRYASWQEQEQASTAALITLLMTALWVLAVIARPYQWWRLALVLASGLAYVVIFSLPLAREKFLLDASNLATTSIALAVGVVGAATIEAMWWIRSRMLGVKPRVWR